jgi:ATPase subunit of ABC transporter with duplicated ATPase domains
VRGKLAEVLFGREDVEKKIQNLSGGEMARLAFCRLSVVEPTVLVLDEPTNHLDLEGIEALAQGLEKYPNAIIFVSHDRWFVSRLATRILEITENGVEDFKGTYDEFLQWSETNRDHLDRDSVLAKEREKKRAAK